MADLLLGLQSSDQLPPAVKQELDQILASIQASVNQQSLSLSSFISEVSGQIGSGTLAAIPTNLGSDNAGFRYFITDYGHSVTWDGSAWDWTPGDDGNGFLVPFPVTPSQAGWGLCDGSSYTYLIMGATITTGSFTTPNLTGSPAYIKAGAAYAGITAKAGSTGTGSTGTGTATGSTDNDTGITEGAPSPLTTVDNNGGGSTVQVASSVHLHTPFTPHNHTISLGIPSLTVPALDAGTIDMEHITVPMYFRR